MKITKVVTTEYLNQVDFFIDVIEIFNAFKGDAITEKAEMDEELPYPVNATVYVGDGVMISSYINDDGKIKIEVNREDGKKGMHEFLPIETESAVVAKRLCNIVKKLI